LFNGLFVILIGLWVNYNSSKSLKVSVFQISLLNLNYHYERLIWKGYNQAC